MQFASFPGLPLSCTKVELAPKTATNDGLNPGAKPFVPVPNSPTLLVDGKDAILLQTASVFVQLYLQQ